MILKALNSIIGCISIFFISKIGRMKIRNKFLLSFITLIFIISLLLLPSVITVCRTIFEDYTMELSAKMVTAMAHNIAYRIKEIDDFTYYAIQDQQLKSYLYDSLGHVSETEQTILNKKIRSSLNSIAVANEYIKAVIIKNPHNNYYWWEKGERIKTGLPLTQSTAKMHVNQIIVASLPSDNSILLIKSPFGTDEIILSRPIIDENHINNRLGTVIFIIDSKYLIDIANDNAMIKNDNITLLDHNDKILVESPVISQRFYAQLSSNDLYNDTHDKMMVIRFKNNHYILAEENIPHLDWKILCLISQDNFNRGMTFLSTIIKIICVLCMFISIIFAYIISSGITKNILLLEKSMVEIEKGNFDIRIKPSSYDEIGHIGLKFNYMARRIKELIHTAYRAELDKQKAEFLVLKAQINPHFLYNTLGSVKWLARMKKQKEIEDIVTSLIELLKTAVKRKGTYQTLEEEIDYIRYYMALQKFCYEDRFAVRYEIAPAVENYYVLNFILQPIVENALYHGIELSKGNGLITIRAYSKERDLVIEVIDNGIGMSEEKIKQILHGKKGKGYAGLSSIGVKNVNERIMMYFGKKYGLIYKSEMGKGTTVMYHLPVIEKPLGDEEI